MLTLDTLRPWNRTGSFWLALVGVAGVGLLVLLFHNHVAGNSPREQAPPSPAPEDQRSSQPSSTLFAVFIRKPSDHPTIPTGAVDDKGQPIQLGCAVCHSVKPVETSARLGTPLKLFHQGLAGKHANLSCVSCHNPADGYASLRLADGTRVPYSEVMTLCAQCHGPQYRDYQHGAHGGMTGHWDLKRGPRQRNNCIHCHDPHSPKYPVVNPAPGPNDRFQGGSAHE
jgi:hypothetical protein